LHLGGEFAESNLGTAQERDGSLTVRLIAGQYGFAPDCVKAAVDTPVKFRLTSTDVVHGFLLPSTNVNTDGRARLCLRSPYAVYPVRHLPHAMQRVLRRRPPWHVGPRERRSERAIPDLGTDGKVKLCTTVAGSLFVTIGFHLRCSCRLWCWAFGKC